MSFYRDITELDFQLVSALLALLALLALRAFDPFPQSAKGIIAFNGLRTGVPYNLHTILTDNGIQFADLPKNREGWTAHMRVDRLDQICREHAIEHRLTKTNHPWANGQV